MRGILCCVFIVIIIGVQITETKVQGSRQVDSLLIALDEAWADDEEECKEATFLLLNAVRNQTTWATWIWDSMQLPVAVLYGSRYHLGSFDQCLEDPWSKHSTQYCLVDVKLTEDTRSYEEVAPEGPIKDFVSIKTKHGRRRLNIYSFGVCLPSACAPSSVARISHHIHQLSHLPFGTVSVDSRNCQVKESLEYTIGYYAFWYLIYFLTFIATAVYVIHDSFCYITDPKLIKIANWFSPSLNFQALIKTNQEELTSLNGLRAASAITAVVLHYYMYVGVLTTINPVDIGKSMDTRAGRLAVQLALVIDTFFLLSGLLHMKGLLTNSSNLLQMLWKRYFRLLAPFAMSILYMSSVLPHTVSGPLRPQLIREQQETCVKNWWSCLLMVNNYVRTNEICHIVTWYLACDYQLTILGTALFYFCRKWRRQTAVVFCLAVYLMSLIVPAVLTYWNELPPILAYDNDDATCLSGNKVFHTTYIKPYSRASAYLIGLALGYMIHSYKPKDYRNRISKTWSILGGTLVFVILISLMDLGGLLNKRAYSSLEVSAYAALDRSVYALGISILIIVCEYGTFPLIGDFLTSILFLPLSRLSYGVYIFHPVLIYMNVYSARAPITYGFYNLFVNGSGYIIVAYVISYLQWFIVEAPAMNITNSLFRNRTRKTEIQNGTLKVEVRQNGIKQTKIS